MTDVDVDLERAAVWAAGPWIGLNHHEDLLQVARLAAWQAGQSWRPDGGRSRRSWARFKARNAVLDELRCWVGRAGRLDTVPLEGDSVDRVPLDHLAALAVEDLYLVEHPEPSPPATLTRAELAVWRDLARGWRARQIARSRGVTESAISQHVRSIRAKFRQAAEEPGTSAA